MPRGRLLLFVLASALPAVFFSALLWSGELGTLYRITRHPQRTTGRIVGKSCLGGTFYFDFGVAGRVYRGQGPADRNGGRCANLVVGSPVPVSYAADNPTRNVASADPDALWRWNGSAAIAIAVVMTVATGAVLRYYSRHPDARATAQGPNWPFGAS